MNSLTFQELNLAAPLLRAVAEAGYTRPSPIQEKAIPPVLAGRDLLGCAQTGTGKTAAFALPILQRLSAAAPAGRPVRALVLTPTRELALQIHDSFIAYGRHLALRSAVIFGGVGQAPQVAALAAGVDVLTATPGRLNDLIGQGYVDLSRLEVFVLDEADRMLDMGFIHDVRRVLAHLPQKRQTLLFSATMPPEIEALAGSILHRPVKVMVTPPATTVERIRQSVCLVDKADKKTPAGLSAEGHECGECPGVYPHQARGRPRGARAGPCGHHGHGHPRQQKPDGPPARPGRVPGRAAEGAGGHGYRRPGH